jgi:hypothetical protein
MAPGDKQMFSVDRLLQVSTIVNLQTNNGRCRLIEVTLACRRVWLTDVALQYLVESFHRKIL